MRSTIPEYAKHFPRNFYGNKARLLDDILSLVPTTAETFTDLFGGTGIVGWAAKRRGLKVITNDIMLKPYLYAKALVVNNMTLLTDNDLSILSAPNSLTTTTTATRDMYGHIYGRANSAFLDNWTANIRSLSDPVKRDIAIFLPVVCTAKHLRFAAHHFSANAMPTGNQVLWEIDMKTEMFAYAKNIFPSLLYNNNRCNLAYQSDAVSLVKSIQTDVLYVDTPYCARAGNYEDNYAFLDDLTKTFSGRAADIQSRTDGKADLADYTDFMHRGSSLNGFMNLFRNAQHIPMIIVSYNSTSALNADEIEIVARMFGRDVARRTIEQPRARANKSSPKTTDEVLLTCWLKDRTEVSAE